MGTSMPDTLRGWFIESCDCESLCPCWIDDEPDDNHCTGLFAWVVEDGSLGDVDVSGARIASVSTHNGRRRAPEGGRYSILFVDVGSVEDREAAFPALERAFRSPEGGVLAELAEVNGVVLAGDGQQPRHLPLVARLGRLHQHRGVDRHDQRRRRVR